MLFQQTKKNKETGTQIVRYDEIYKNPKVDVFEFNGAMYLMGADFLKGIANESQLRLKLKRQGGKAIEEDRELRIILFGRAKSKSIKFYSIPNNLAKTIKVDSYEIKPRQFSSNYGIN